MRGSPVIELVKLGREHRHESANTVPIRAHIHVHPARHGGKLVHIIRVAVTEAKAQVTVAGQTRCAGEVTAVGLTVQAWTKVGSPNTEDHWTREMAIEMRRDPIAAKPDPKGMVTGVLPPISGRLVRKGGDHGENEVSAHTVKDWL
ncbi:hypothetical protein PV11_09504 [Exophiala sideris]|uniref:Uncharacterized protein n=1 Tax=Exophiala sideris TaxID=1016849 RepID=A0A0D1Y4F8_9EURO|nr:hypothetical protein PV11_09504 [Exophiala sideris]